MIDFEEELRKFKPSPDISAVEDIIAKSDISDTDTFKALKGKCFEASYNNDFRKVIGDGYLENKRP